MNSIFLNKSYPTSIIAPLGEPLARLILTFEDNRLDVDFDLCTSQPSALRKLLASPYQLIIAGAHLAEIDDFLLLKHCQSLKEFVPLVVTASASEKQSAGRVLAQGAFDLIPTPPDHEQTVSTIRLGLWYCQLKNLIACKEKAVDKCRQHLADYPGDRIPMEASFNRALSAFEKTISTVEQTLLRIEESAGCLSDCAMKVEHQARTQAFTRLDDLRP